MTQVNVLLAHRKTNMRWELSYSLHLFFLSSLDLLIIHTSDLCPSRAKEPKQRVNKSLLHSYTVSVLYFCVSCGFDQQHILSVKPQANVRS